VVCSRSLEEEHGGLQPIRVMMRVPYMTALAVTTTVNM
jgi:hypothetical protein